MLFIQSYLRGDFESLHFKLAILAIMWLLVTIAVIIDLFSGIRKARERGELRTSIGFRQTVSKVVQYFSFLLFAFLFDCLLMLILDFIGLNELKILPFATIVASCFLIYIEWKSFMEKADEKYKRQFSKSASELLTLLEKREDLVHQVHTMIKELDNKK